MYKFTLENEKGEQLNFNQIGGAFTIEDINGLSPASATINTSAGAYIDGALYNSSKVDMRTLEIAFAIERNAAANRIEVYKVLKPKQQVRAYYESSVRSVQIDGYVKSVNIDHFGMKQVVTVSILCPSPFWESAQQVVSELSTVRGLFHFPFASTETPELVFSYLDPYASVEVINEGDVQTGIIIELYANAPVSNPRIYDYLTGEHIALNYSMQAADLITIDTRTGKKTVTLLRNGATSNIFNSLAKDSKWLQLDFGGSVYAYEVGTGEASDLIVTIKHMNLYEGV